MTILKSLKIFIFICFFNSFILFGSEIENQFIVCTSKKYLLEKSKKEIVQSILCIASEQPDSIENWLGNRIYLKPSRIRITYQGAFICNKESFVKLPTFASDERGIFVLCSKEELQKEADEHFDRAGKALIGALGHSAAAGATIEYAPVAIYEGYQAVEAWKEMAKEYNAGCDAEKRAAAEE